MTNRSTLLWRLHDIDERIHQRVADMHAPILDSALPPLSEAASYSRLWLAIAASIGVLGGRRGRRSAAAALAATGVTSFLANIVAKELANRRRPGVEVPAGRRLEHPTSTSFPSGHAASAAAFSGVIGSEIPELYVPVNALAAAVAFSRVYTGVHYPGDVVAGWLLGRTVAVATRRILRRIDAR